jgi:hypothetical protein
VETLAFARRSGLDFLDVVAASVHQQGRRHRDTIVSVDRAGSSLSILHDGEIVALGSLTIGVAASAPQTVQHKTSDELEARTAISQ